MSLLALKTNTGGRPPLERGPSRNHGAQPAQSAFLRTATFLKHSPPRKAIRCATTPRAGTAHRVAKGHVRCDAATVGVSCVHIPASAARGCLIATARANSRTTWNRARCSRWVASAAAEGPASRAGAAAADGGGGAAEHYDVVIVGGGPAGLLAAKALMAALPGASIKVFEAAPGYRPQGAGVLIEVNGWRALHAVNAELAERIRSRGILITGSNYFDEKGRPLAFQQPPNDHEGNLRAYGHTSVMVHWGDIRQSLFESLPEGTVSFSSRVVGLTPGELGGRSAVLEIQEPERAAAVGAAGAAGCDAVHNRTVTADLVVAADGYYSRSKRLAFGATGPPLLPTFRGRVIWRALVGYPDPDQVPPLLREAGSRATAVWWLADGQPPDRTALVYPVNDNRFVWTCIALAEDVEAAGLPHWTPHRGADQDLGIQQTGAVGSDPKQRCLAVFRNHPPEVLDLLSRTDPRVIMEHGYYSHDTESIRGAPDWVRGNVVLVGDAAHTGPPDGQGLNMAWEDVAVLAAELGGRGLASREALEAYCAARLPRVHAMWSEPGLHKPRRTAAKLSAAFTPVGPGSSGLEKTAPQQPPPRSPGHGGDAATAAAAATTAAAPQQGQGKQQQQQQRQ